MSDLEPCSIPNTAEAAAGAEAGGHAAPGGPHEDSFETESRRALGRVRASYIELMAGIPGTTRRAAEVGRNLSLEKKVAWQIFKIITSDDPLTAASHVPAGTTVDRVVKAASMRGATSEAAEAVREATRELDTIIKRYAGNRPLFETMVSSIISSRAPVDVSHYRSAYRANTHIYGAYSRAQVACHIYHCSLEDPSLLDLAMLHGQHDLCKTNSSPYMNVGSVALRRDSDGPIEGRIESIDPDDSLGIGLIQEFSTPDESQFQIEHKKAGLADLKVRMLDRGLAGRSTIFLGHVMRRAAKVRRNDTDDVMSSTNQFGSTPTELGILDVLVHTPTFGIVNPEVFWLRDAGRNKNLIDPADHPDRQLVPPRDCMTMLVGGVDSLTTPETPKQAELVRWGLRKLGWDDSEYQVFRCRVEYPLLPSSLFFDFMLPE